MSNNNLGNALIGTGALLCLLPFVLLLLLLPIAFVIGCLS